MTWVMNQTMKMCLQVEEGYLAKISTLLAGSTPLRLKFAVALPAIGR